MRKVLLAAVFMGLFASAPVWAQKGGNPFFSDVKPSDIHFTPIDTSNVVAMPSVPQVGTQSRTRAFLSRLSPLNWFSSKPNVVSPGVGSFPSLRHKSSTAPLAPVNSSN
jgi:hypothetical protein